MKASGAAATSIEVASTGVSECQSGASRKRGSAANHPDEVSSARSSDLRINISKRRLPADSCTATSALPVRRSAVRERITDSAAKKAAAVRSEAVRSSAAPRTSPAMAPNSIPAHRFSSCARTFRLRLNGLANIGVKAARCPIGVMFPFSPDSIARSTRVSDSD
ncbi:hypothetical protein ABT324_26110 [Saccharopolyspora sp. NPDC000359]|uniref:hypothetical protein n=1 Tax=Saccharopolyspora sp. NPDC000359 TaxID=3154251 RepID=UPI003322C536